MQNRCLKIAVVSCACILSAASIAQAQRTALENQSTVRARVDVQAAGSESQLRRPGLEAVIGTLNELIAMPVPRGATPAERTAWNEQTEWLTGVRDRYRELAVSYAAVDSRPAGQQTAAPAIPGGAVVSSAVNGQFNALQQAIQNESRKFQTLSNAAKARHDAAMNSIRNMKG